MDGDRVGTQKNDGEEGFQWITVDIAGTITTEEKFE